VRVAPVAAGSTLEVSVGGTLMLVDVRHPERLIGRGSVALPSASSSILFPA